MADNVPITAGSGTTISTEEVTTLNGGAVSAQHAQRVIVATRTADGTAVDADLTSGTAGTPAGGVSSVQGVSGMVALKVDGSAVTQPVSGTLSLTDISAAEYETVAASQTDQALGATGATGDYLAGLLVVPATAAAGAVSIKDGSGSSITVFAGGGTTALPTLAPIPVPLGIKSTGGAWKVTTGANVSVIGIGNFT